MKYNLGILKGHQVVFKVMKDKHWCFVNGTIVKTKQNKTHVNFYFNDGRVFTINDEILRHMEIERSWDKTTIFFTENDSKSLISGLVGFTMFDTFGFPLELTQEILLEDGYVLHTSGFEVLRQLQKEMNSNTFKNKDAFGDKERKGV